METAWRLGRPRRDVRGEPDPGHDIVGAQSGTVIKLHCHGVGRRSLVDPRDRAAVPHLRVDPFGRPGQVVVEFEPGREERLVVDEIDEPAAVVQVGEEAVAAGRVAERDQVLRERDLHRGAVEQHASVPAEVRLAFDETGAQLLLWRNPFVVFLDRDGECQVRRAEPNSDDVVYAVVRTLVRHEPLPPALVR